MSAAAHRRDNRVFHYAVLLSIVLHGLALLAVPSLRDASRRVEVWPGPLAARLVQPPSAPVAAAPEPAKPEPPAIKPAAKPAPSPRPAPVAKAPPTVSPQPVAPPSPQAAAEPAPAPSSAAPAQNAAAATPAARPGAELDADSIGRFRILVIQEAVKYKRYPRAATDNNWEGRADVRVTFNSEGKRASIVIVRSSGYEVLDQQAIDMVTKAFVPVPPALRGKEFAFEIPVIFNLKDTSSQ